MPSFTQVLQAITDAWGSRRQEPISGGQRLAESIKQQSRLTSGPRRSELDRDVLYSPFHALQQQFDQAHGGLGRRSKFPQPTALEFPLRHHHSTGNANALAMVTRTLETMARGGMYDQLGGGFHSYSVDERWLTPHSEKMLHDNPQRWSGSAAFDTWVGGDP